MDRNRYASRLSYAPLKFEEKYYSFYLPLYTIFTFIFNVYFYIYLRNYPSSSNVAVGCRRSKDQNVSLLKAVLRESNGDLASPDIVTAGEEISSVNPLESKNYTKYYSVI